VGQPISDTRRCRAQILAIILYRNQNRILYHPVIPGTERDPSANPAKYRNPQEWGMPYEDVAVSAPPTPVVSLHRNAVPGSLYFQ